MVLTMLVHVDIEVLLGLQFTVKILSHELMVSALLGIRVDLA